MVKQNQSKKRAQKGKAKRKAIAKGGKRVKSDGMVPRKISKGAERIEREDEGPLSWFVDQTESTYARLSPVAEVPPERPSRTIAAVRRSLRRGGVEVLDTAPKFVWLDRLSEYKKRKVAAFRRATTRVGPVVPGGRNWVPLGPTVVHNGQTVGEEPVAGRIAGLAIASDGNTIYAASACGGVFRSDDAGTSWRSLMDGFDVDPTNFASTSLACGAIAIDKNNPNRVYVGTGEGDTHQIFKFRIVNALPAYRGIGPICSDDGGMTWVNENVSNGSPELAGEAFFALAVDPTDSENVVGAATSGLYQRVPNGNTHEWKQRKTGVFSSVVVTQSDSSIRFFAAEWGVGVIHSTNGSSWSTTGSGFPSANVGRIALGVQANNPNLVYAFVINSDGAALGIFRLDGVGGEWKKVENPPNVIPLNGGRGQGDYDVAIAVDPADAELLYLGGSYSNSSPFPASIWRCPVVTVSGGFKFNATKSIGTHAHADVHVLTHSPGNSNELWCGCDGGVFLNRAPQSVGQFAGMNAGLSCLCSNFIGQHPIDPGIVFTGLQDNGTARTSGAPEWSHVNYGDGGYCLVNWNDPNKVLSFVNGTILRSTTGGKDHNDWTATWDFSWATMTQPIVSPRFDQANPQNANWIAVGAGAKVFISKDFTTSWPMQLTIPGGTSAGDVFALAFVSTERLFIGTTRGQVFRADRNGSTWNTSRIDNVTAGPLSISGLVTDIACDWSDSSLNSIYLAFGGLGDPRHVWRFDGSKWEARSGTTSGNDLLDVEHNALAVDIVDPKNVYVGANIGVWHSADKGLTWEALQNGLPDAPVFDLQFHPTQRLLRAATHGRGVYEWKLD